MRALPTNRYQLLAAALMLALLSGCASTNGPDTPSASPDNGDTVTAGPPSQGPGSDAVYDPIEGFNRWVFGFNETVDKYALGPAADAWVFITPAPARRGVGNFFNNLAYPGTAVNNLLQGKGETALRDSLRFVVNSTLGVGGFLDPASSMGLEEHNEDFGQTLGVWGVDSGAYLMLPLLGPSSTRDVTRYPVAWYTDALTYASLDTVTQGGLIALNIVNRRAQLGRALNIRNEAALDPYAFTRSSYDQQRRNQVYDGNLPGGEDDPYGDFFNDGGDGAGPPPPPGD